MADFKPILPKDFDASKVSFAYSKAMSSGAKLFFLEYDGAPLYIQSPEMGLTFDPQVFEDGPDAKYNIKTNLNLSNEQCKVFHDKMMEFDEKIKTLAKSNSVEWFKKKNISDDVIESMFTPTVRVYIDPDSGEPTGRYPPSFGFKVKKKEGKIQCRCFTEDKREINFNDKDGENYMEFTKCLKKNAQVKGLFKCDFVWHSPGKFGCTWSAQQLRVKIPKGFDEYAFMDDSDEDEVSEKLQQGNYVESDSDEEETVEVA
jgi:hypothetical protein